MFHKKWLLLFLKELNIYSHSSHELLRWDECEWLLSDLTQNVSFAVVVLCFWIPKFRTTFMWSRGDAMIQQRRKGELSVNFCKRESSFVFRLLYFAWLKVSERFALLWWMNEFLTLKEVKCYKQYTFPFLRHSNYTHAFSAR